MVWKSDQNYSALISNPDTYDFVHKSLNDLKVWSELLRTDQQSWHWSVLIRKKYPELISADQNMWGGGKVLPQWIATMWQSHVTSHNSWTSGKTTWHGLVGLDGDDAWVTMTCVVTILWYRVSIYLTLSSHNWQWPPIAHQRTRMTTQWRRHDPWPPIAYQWKRMMTDSMEFTMNSHCQFMYYYIWIPWKNPHQIPWKNHQLCCQK